MTGLTCCFPQMPVGGADSYTERLREAEHPPAAVLDVVVYHPCRRRRWPPRAQAVGAVCTIGGFEFLLHQAARQVELMTGQQAPVAAMRAGGLAELAGRGASANSG